MRRDAKLNVYAFALPGLPRRLRVRGRALRADIVEVPRRHGGAIAVIVERVREPPSLSEDALREQHAIVMDLWRQTDSLLPVRFGTVIDERELNARVTTAAPALARSLHHVRGRVQMTVRVFGAPVEGATALPTSSGTAYLMAVRDRTAAISTMAAEVRLPVDAFVADERVEPGQGGLRVSVFHLIAAADAAAYRAALEASLAGGMQGRVTVTGPWPPFAFAPELGR